MPKFGNGPGDQNPRHWLGKTGLAHYRSVPVVSPDGVFESMKAAAEHRGCTYQTIQFIVERASFGDRLKGWGRL